MKKLVMEYHESRNQKVEILKTVLESDGFQVIINPRNDVENLGLLFANKK